MFRFSRPDLDQHRTSPPHAFLPNVLPNQDYRINWANSPLRPEFAESTYFLYKATEDPVYLEVGKLVMRNLQEHARVKCGWAAVEDIRGHRMRHGDYMDSFVLVGRLERGGGRLSSA